MESMPFKSQAMEVDSLRVHHHRFWPWLLSVRQLGQFAIAALGEDGLAQLTDVLAKETSITLAQLGLCDMQSVDGRCISDLCFPMLSQWGLQDMGSVNVNER